jgi:hypothetical protein
METGGTRFDAPLPAGALSAAPADRDGGAADQAGGEPPPGLNAPGRVANPGANPVDTLDLGGSTQPSRLADETQPEAVDQAAPPVSRVVDEVFRDPLLWGAAGGTPAAGPGVAATGLRVLATPGVVTADATPALAEAPAEAGLPAPQGAGLLAGSAPLDLQALDAVLKRFLDQLQVLSWQLSDLLARLPLAPWLAAVGVLAVACEVYRRRLQQARRALALAWAGTGEPDGPPELPDPA